MPGKKCNFGGQGGMRQEKVQKNCGGGMLQVLCACLCLQAREGSSFGFENKNNHLLIIIFILKTKHWSLPCQFLGTQPLR